MKYTKIRIYKENKTVVGETLETAIVPTVSFFSRPVVIIAILTTVAGTLGLLSQNFPALSWTSMAYGVVNLILTTYETVISQQSIVSETPQDN